MQKQKITDHVSKVDVFLEKFDKKHKKSASQQAEIDKYEEIGRLRDSAVSPEKKKKSDIWENF